MKKSKIDMYKFEKNGTEAHHMSWWPSFKPLIKMLVKERKDKILYQDKNRLVLKDIKYNEILVFTRRDI